MIGPLTSRRVRRVALAAGIAVAAVLIALAAFPYGLLRGTIESQASTRFGRPVLIGAVERVDRFGFTPTIAIREVHIPQPAWVGEGDMLRLDRAQATLPVWPMLIGSLRPRDTIISGLRATLVRDRNGRTNWSRPGAARRKGGGGFGIEGLTVRDAILDYRDAKRDRRAVVGIVSDPRTGLRATGSGVVRGAAVRIAVAGPPLTLGRPWPFSATIDGRDLAMTARGTMARPLDTARMEFDVTARAADLSLVDAVIEAGLFRTQPVRLSAHVRRDAPKWRITGLKGTIGRSAIAGTLDVDKVDGRSKLDGAIRSPALDFDDFSSDEGLASGRALERRIGSKLVPNLRVNIAKIDKTDGIIRFRVDRIVSKQGPPAIRAMRGTLTMDHRLLRIDPLVLTLARGGVNGHAIVDQHDGRPSPRVTLDLRLRNSDVLSLVGGADSYTGRVDGRARLTGTGDTLRAAVGRSDGRVGFVIRDGALPGRIAAALGFDAVKAVLSGSDDRAHLRCVVVGLAMRHGRGRTDPLVVDTSQSRLDGAGIVTFPTESLSVRLTGAPKQGGGLRLPGAVVATGTLKAPSIYVPPQVKSVGNVFKAIGRAIRGDQGPLATDANCDALAARVLR